MSDAIHHLTTFLIDGNCGKIWYVKGLYERCIQNPVEMRICQFFYPCCCKYKHSGDIAIFQYKQPNFT